MFYNSTINDVVLTTTNTTLNGKLYSKIILLLEGKALKHAVSRKHLHANGLLLLRELTKTYKPTNVPGVIAAKTVEFWDHRKRLPQESIDQYYDRFHELLDDLQDADEPFLPRVPFISLFSHWAQNLNLFKIISVSGFYRLSCIMRIGPLI